MSTRDPPGNERYTQTTSKGMEKDISCQLKIFKSWCNNIYTDKIDFKTTAIVKDKGHYIMINPTKGHYIKGTIQQKDITTCKHLCTRHRSTHICKANLDGYKGRD